MLDGSLNCRVACWQCRRSAATKELDLPIVKSGLRHALCDIFNHRSTPVDNRLLSKTTLVKTLVDYKDSPSVNKDDTLIGFTFVDETN
jgi:hypothetical protein